MREANALHSWLERSQSVESGRCALNEQRRQPFGWRRRKNSKVGSGVDDPEALSLRLATAQAETDSAEAKQHHRPGTGFGDRAGTLGGVQHGI